MQLISRTCIRADFEGWDPDTIYELDDGTAWKLAQYRYEYCYMYRPEAQVWREGGRHYLQVHGMNEPVEVDEVPAPHGPHRIPLYRWNGSYFGFMYGGRVFDAAGHYLGWLDDDLRAWRANGRYWGQLIDEHYILRRQSAGEPSPRTPRTPPTPPSPMAPPGDRGARAPRGGWVDALAE